MAVKIIYRILSVAAFGLMYIFTGLVVLTVIPFVYMRGEGVVKSITWFWANTIFLIIGKRIHVEGRENISKDLHFMLLANHSSLFDIVAIISVLPDIAWFGHERLLRIPVFRRFLILTGYIPLRKTSYINTKKMVEGLKERSKTNNIAIFPEGTRSLDGKMNDFYRGFIFLLRSADIDVLPVTLNGFYSMKPKNRFYINFSSRPEIIIHKPLSRKFLVERSDDEIAGLIRSTIVSSIKNSDTETSDNIEIGNPNKILA